MSVTEDRERAAALYECTLEAEHDEQVVDLLAAALAAEREKARAPFLALAHELEAPVMRAAIYLGEHDQGRREGEDAERLRVASEIRQAAQAEP